MRTKHCLFEWLYSHNEVGASRADRFLPWPMPLIIMWPYHLFVSFWGAGGSAKLISFNACHLLTGRKYPANDVVLYYRAKD